MTEGEWRLPGAGQAGMGSQFLTWAESVLQDEQSWEAVAEAAQQCGKASSH